MNNKSFLLWQKTFFLSVKIVISCIKQSCIKCRLGNWMFTFQSQSNKYNRIVSYFIAHSYPAGRFFTCSFVYWWEWNLVNRFLLNYSHLNATSSAAFLKCCRLWTGCSELLQGGIGYISLVVLRLTKILMTKLNSNKLLLDTNKNFYWRKIYFAIYL